MPALIFPAGPADAEDLARVHVAAWRESYRGLIPDAYLDRMDEAAHAKRFLAELTKPDEQAATLAAADRGGLIGYASGGPSRRKAAGEAEVHTLYVRVTAQRQGVGRGLLTGMARFFADRGARGLMISTLRDNLPARRFYERMGGRAETPRQEHGPGGLLYEVAYVWPELSSLVD